MKFDFTKSYRPYPRVVEPESSGTGVKRSNGKPITRPQLTARWLVSEDGRLVCQWHITP